MNLILGFQNPWRVKEFIQEKKPTLLDVAQHNSTKNAERLLAVYLYKHGWLQLYVRAVEKEDIKDDNAGLIVQVSEKSLSVLEKDWSMWLDGVIIDAKSQNSTLDTVPTSFVLESRAEWERWAATHEIILP